MQKARDLGEQVKGYTDVRRMLESKEIDVVTIATPNHWHSLCAIWAVQAGKDVYVEKPVSHNIWEGRQLVNAARRYGRLVQAGTQIRSNPGVQEAIAWLREGHLGKILCARGFCYKRRPSIGKVPGPQPIPQASITIYGAGRLPKARCCASASTMTGIGCGPPVTATSATRAFTRWTWPVGCSDKLSLLLVS